MNQANNNAIAIIASQFNQHIVKGLIDGATEALRLRGVDATQVLTYFVPGAYEIPLICQQVARAGQVSGIIALGAVIQGETAHFEYVAGECAKGISHVSLSENIPISFGVLATHTLEQALARSTNDMHNKGHEAANALLDMLRLIDDIKKPTVQTENNSDRVETK